MPFVAALLPHPCDPERGQETFRGLIPRIIRELSAAPGPMRKRTTVKESITVTNRRNNEKSRRASGKEIYVAVLLIISPFSIVSRP